MNNNNTQLLRKLNAYDYSDYNAIILYIQTRNNANPIFPAYVNTNVKRNRYIARFDNHFSIRLVANRNEIFHTFFEVERQVVRDNLGGATLQSSFYDKNKMFNAGINLFYSYIRNKYINLTKSYISSWLHNQQIVQLVRPKKKIIEITPKFFEYGHWAVDLVEIKRPPPVHNIYIFSAIDLYSRKPYFRLLGVNKTGPIVRDAFNHIRTHDLVAPEIIRTIYADNGSEFISRAFKNNAQNHNIVLKHAPSHTPIPSIESLNRRLRVAMDFHFASNANTNFNAVMLAQIQKSMQLKATLTQPKLTAEDAHNVATHHNMQPYLVGDHVRVHIRAIYPKYRKKMKLGEKKNLHIQFSVVVFVISRVIQSNRVSSLPRYEVSLQNNQQFLDAAGNVQQFRHIDLRKINLHNTQNIRVNTVNEALNIMGLQ